MNKFYFLIVLFLMVSSLNVNAGFPPSIVVEFSNGEFMVSDKSKNQLDSLAMIFQELKTDYSKKILLINFLKK